MMGFSGKARGGSAHANIGEAKITDDRGQDRPDPVLLRSEQPQSERSDKEGCHCSRATCYNAPHGTAHYGGEDAEGQGSIGAGRSASDGNRSTCRFCFGHVKVFPCGSAWDMPIARKAEAP